MTKKRNAAHLIMTMVLRVIVQDPPDPSHTDKGERGHRPRDRRRKLETRGSDRWIPLISGDELLGV